jgi:hypothetical protein
MYVIRPLPVFNLWMLIYPDGFIEYVSSWKESIEHANAQIHYIFETNLDSVRQRVNCE